MTVHALTIVLEDWHQLMHRRLTGEEIRPTPTGLTTTHRLLDTPTLGSREGGMARSG